MFWNSLNFNEWYMFKSCQFLFICLSRVSLVCSTSMEWNGWQLFLLTISATSLWHMPTKCTQTNLLFLLSLARVRCASDWLIYFYNFILHMLLTFMNIGFFLFLVRTTTIAPHHEHFSQRMTFYEWNFKNKNKNKKMRKYWKI